MVQMLIRDEEYRFWVEAGRYGVEEGTGGGVDSGVEKRMAETEDRTCARDRSISQDA
jgi:hypothetical protein